MATHQQRVLRDAWRQRLRDGVEPLVEHLRAPPGVLRQHVLKPMVAAGLQAVVEDGSKVPRIRTQQSTNRVVIASDAPLLRPVLLALTPLRVLRVHNV